MYIHTGIKRARDQQLPCDLSLVSGREQRDAEGKLRRGRSPCSTIEAPSLHSIHSCMQGRNDYHTHTHIYIYLSSAIYTMRKMEHEHYIKSLPSLHNPPSWVNHLPHIEDTPKPNFTLTRPPCYNTWNYKNTTSRTRCIRKYHSWAFSCLIHTCIVFLGWRMFEVFNETWNLKAYI